MSKRCPYTLLFYSTQALLTVPSVENTWSEKNIVKEHLLLT